MQVQSLLAVLIMGTELLAQSGTTAPCPADRPIDDIIAEVNTQKSGKSRNRNPLPDNICILGWCRNTRTTTPPNLPETTSRVETHPTPHVSSSKNAADLCDEAMELALEVAHDVDVGDYYFGEKNYRAALMRYKDAVEQRPQDSAIHVRLGRVFEKFNDLPHAIEHYNLAQRLSGPQKWSNEARAAIGRLKGSPAFPTPSRETE